MPDKSILIVDDAEFDRLILKKHLQKIGFSGEIFEKIDGLEALEFLEDYDSNKALYPEGFPPFYIFLDINMPRMDGFEFLESFTALLEKDPRYSSIVVMMISSSSMRGDIDKAHSYSCVREYIIKGEYTLESLAELLKDDSP